MNDNVLLKDVKLDTTTTFSANGDIQIHACPWNEGFEPLTPGKEVSFRGRITVMEDGRLSLTSGDKTRYYEGAQELCHLDDVFLLKLDTP